ncbi:glycosyltransferase family 4 protein [Granulosicoccaceae sp. 1_MG-2023]|nr:glycosyltransferase family 4 protein [Granulosicoccaceae sp. 1_MG-2023]
MTPLKIILFSNSFLPQVGGREIVVYHLAKALTGLGHNVRVISPGGFRSERHRRYPFTVQRLPSVPGVSPITSARWILKATIARYGCDVINAHTTYTAGYIALQLKRKSGLPLVITPHGEDIHVIPEIGHGLRLDPQIEPCIREVLQAAERSTAISDSVVASLKDAGCAPERIREIPNGVDFTRFDGHNTLDVRSRYGIAPDKRIVLTVGNYVRRRGHEELVRGWRAIVEANPQAHLVIVGRRTEVLQPIIDEAGIADSVTLTGGVPPVELNPGGEDVVAAFYREAEVYVAPGMSEGSEGLSLALLDAMAAGTAIVATAISGNRDVIVDGANGLMVRPGEPSAIAEGVNRMLSDEALRTACRTQALTDVQPYSWETIAQQYVDTYREAMAAARQAA